MIANNRYRKNLMLACLVFLSSIVSSQNIDFKSSNFKRDKEGFKLAKQNISIADEIRKKGIKKILKMQDAYIILSKAVFYYNKAQSFNPNNAELNYKIGSSLLFTNQKERAYDYLVRARELNSDLPPDFSINPIFVKNISLSTALHIS